MNKYKRNIGFWIRKQCKVFNLTKKERSKVKRQYDDLPWFEKMEISTGLNRVRVINWINRQAMREWKNGNECELIFS